jgi:putative inorganic carbon (hco3(-)) transporter
MRDLVLFALLAVCLVQALKRPWIGIIGWTFVSIMNPQTLAYGSFRTAPAAAAIAVATLIGVLAAPASEKSFPWRREPIVLMLLMCWYCITFPFSFSMDTSFDQLKKVLKIDFMILMALYVLYSRKHIETLVWTLVISLGFYGIKGGLFTLRTGGSFRVWGPPGTYIEGNNELALAIILVIPLMRYLHLQMTVRWQRNAMLASMALMAAAALGSQSRGALLAIVAMAATMWWRSKNKVPGLVLTLLLGVGLLAFMPESWYSRMETIGEYQEDGSAMGRINAWWMAFKLASHNFFGGGFDIYTPYAFGLYAPDPSAIHAAHSIYFQILGEHGFVGLFLFLLLFMLAWSSAGQLRKVAHKNPETSWVSDMGAMCQVALAGYAVGGAFLSLAYFDLPYNIVILIVLARDWYEKKSWLREPVAVSPVNVPGPPGLVRAGRRR